MRQQSAVRKSETSILDIKTAKRRDVVDEFMDDRAQHPPDIIDFSSFIDEKMTLDLNSRRFNKLSSSRDKNYLMMCKLKMLSSHLKMSFSEVVFELICHGYSAYSQDICKVESMTKASNDSDAWWMHEIVADFDKDYDYSKNRFNPASIQKSHDNLENRVGLIDKIMAKISSKILFASDEEIESTLNSIEV